VCDGVTPNAVPAPRTSWLLTSRIFRPHLNAALPSWAAGLGSPSDTVHPTSPNDQYRNPADAPVPAAFDKRTMIELGEMEPQRQRDGADRDLAQETGDDQTANEG
jgi:hypothetical protein